MGLSIVVLLWRVDFNYYTDFSIEIKIEFKGFIMVVSLWRVYSNYYADFRM